MTSLADERAKVLRREVPQDRVAKVNSRDGERSRTKRQLGYLPLNQYTTGLSPYSAAAAIQNPAYANNGAIHLNEDSHPYAPAVAALAREGIPSVGPQVLPFLISMVYFPVPHRCCLKKKPQMLMCTWRQQDQIFQAVVDTDAKSDRFPCCTSPRQYDHPLVNFTIHSP